MGQTITPFLWFNNDAEEAARFYVSVFPEGKLLHVSPMTVTFEVNGQRFIALNGGPQYRFTEAVSFLISCKTQDEVDHYWSALTANGGQEGQCGWLKDKYGLSWQVVPDALGRLLSDSDRERAGRVLNAMLQMRKLVIADLEGA
jgi:predicted 3-demethylubiquinone-9 3-methyltransferase (glyoxalase superfamily)